MDVTTLERELTLTRAAKSRAVKALVATDGDEEIAALVKKFGGQIASLEKQVAEGKAPAAADLQSLEDAIMSRMTNLGELLIAEGGGAARDALRSVVPQLKVGRTTDAYTVVGDAVCSDGCFWFKAAGPGGQLCGGTAAAHHT